MSQNPFGENPQNPNPYNAPMQAGQPGLNPEAQFVLKEIAAQAKASLVVGIISFFCFGIILAPFAIYRGFKAQSMIRQYNLGHEHAGTAQAGKIIGIIVLVLNVGVILFYALLIAGVVGAGM